MAADARGQYATRKTEEAGLPIDRELNNVEMGPARSSYAMGRVRVRIERMRSEIKMVCNNQGNTNITRRNSPWREMAV